MTDDKFLQIVNENFDIPVGDFVEPEECIACRAVNAVAGALELSGCPDEFVDLTTDLVVDALMAAGLL